MIFFEVCGGFTPVIVLDKWRWLVVDVVGLSGFFVPVNIDNGSFVVFLPGDELRLILLVGFRLFIVVGVLDIWGWLFNMDVLLSLWFLPVKSDWRLLIVFTPLNWERFVEGELFSGFIPVIVVNLRKWLFREEVLVGGLIVVVKINNWLFVPGFPVLRVLEGCIFFSGQVNITVR